ncbi:MAG TPA: orotate phosphoribosyltransferase [Dongiaceae bacterium]|nr:orotate phosphoribosyltransferase [Dongiaceae bacterium]
MSSSGTSGPSGPTVARALLEIGAVLMRPRDPFILTSGRASPVYVDCRKVIGFPRARALITQCAIDAIWREIGVEALDVIAGGETAGIPYAAWIADKLGLPMAYVRKKPKGFGRNAQIEGVLPEGARTLLVEDLATDGGSKLNFINAIRTAGGKVSHALVVFHYGIFPQALDDLKAQGVSLIGLATWWDVLQVAGDLGHLSAEEAKDVRSFLENPEAWSAARGGKAPN